MPRWLTRRPPGEGEDPSVQAGAALVLLDQVTTDGGAHLPLLRARLALQAAETCMMLIGRTERAPEMRDEVHLLRPGEQPGPAGQVFQLWLEAIRARPESAHAMRVLPENLRDPDLSGALAGVSVGHPIARAASVLAQALPMVPRNPAAALIRADMALARACGWSQTLPVLCLGLRLADLNQRAEHRALTSACLRAVWRATGSILPLAADLERRVAHLQSIAPKLRAKPSDAAVERFLTRDAIAPGVGLRDLMSDRAARRLCDRLVSLGAVREVTGRDTFRLYGI